jgi:CelD/BcsL family acetyltransferase involved in cellulose biosynthesis
MLNAATRTFPRTTRFSGARNAEILSPAEVVPTRDFRIAVVDNAADFAAMREEWNELLSASRSDSVFLTWEWLHTWWIHLGRGRSLFIVTVRSGSQLVAIAPLTMTRARVGPFTVPMLEFAGIGTIGSDYLDFIVRSSCQTAAVEAVTAFLAQTGLSVRLPSVKEDSIAATTLRHGLADRGWQWREVPMQVCPFIDLSVGSWQSYLSSLGPSHRYNFRRRLRNLEKDHTVRLEQVSSEEDRSEALKHVVELHLLRWQSRGGSDAFNHPNILAFHQEVSRLAHERGWLRLFVLNIDGHPAAALYGFRYGRTFHFYQSGFDPNFERYSVGLITLGLTIQAAIEEGATEYDLLHGDEAYKFLWTTQVRPLVRLELYAPGRMGWMHRNSVRSISATRKFAKGVLNAVRRQRKS